MRTLIYETKKVYTQSAFMPSYGLMSFD